MNRARAEQIECVACAVFGVRGEGSPPPLPVPACPACAGVEWIYGT